MNKVIYWYLQMSTFSLAFVTLLITNLTCPKYVYASPISHITCSLASPPSKLFPSKNIFSSISSHFSSLLKYESSTIQNKTNVTGYQRPLLIHNAIQNNGTIYYFGIGSNMLKSKLINRGLNGTKINLLSIQPGYVQNYRLAFNLPGFPPIEPAMAGIEPIEELRTQSSFGLDIADECHGSLVQMKASEYQVRLFFFLLSSYF